MKCAFPSAIQACFERNYKKKLDEKKTSMYKKFIFKNGLMRFLNDSKLMILI